MDVEKLVAELRAATMRFDWSDLPDDAAIPAIPSLKKAADALESLARELAEAREVLRPFAENACKGDGTGAFDVPNGQPARFHDLNDRTKPTLLEGHFRAARRFLEGK